MQIVGWQQQAGKKFAWKQCDRKILRVSLATMAKKICKMLS